MAGRAFLAGAAWHLMAMAASASRLEGEGSPPDWAQLCRRRWEERARKDARFYTDCLHHADASAWVEHAVREADLYLAGLDRRALREGRLLEIGCGPGRLLAEFSRCVGVVIGVDVSPTMLRLARDAVSSHGRHVLIHGNGLDLAWLGDACIDLVVMSAVAIHCPLDVIRTYAKEALRVLRPGGRMRMTVNRKADAQSLPPAPDADPLMLGADWCGHAFADGEPEAFFLPLGFRVADVHRLTDTYFGLDLQRP